MNRILITGGTGFLGSYMAYKLLEDKNNEITILSHDEQKAYELNQMLEGKVKFIIGDVYNLTGIEQGFKNQIFDIIIHCAAMKHVKYCEDNKDIAFHTNLWGTNNIIEYALEHECKKFIYISTDKAINPINVYGRTKKEAEEVCLKANEIKNIFTVVRFGNLFASRGSVIPYFIKLYKAGVRDFPITHKDSERYFLTVDQAYQLIKIAMESSDTGIIVGTYKKIKIVDIVKAIDENNTYHEIGLQQGEKLSEEIETANDEYWDFEDVKEMIKAYS